jgi:hypothetical protein
VQYRSNAVTFGGDPPRLILRQQLRRRSPAGLIFEIDIRKRLAAVVAHDKTRLEFVESTRAAGSGECLSMELEIADARLRAVRALVERANGSRAYGLRRAEAW